MAYMFESILKKIPKNRSELVNDLEIPTDARSSSTSYSVDTTEWSDLDVSLTRSDSVFSENMEELIGRPATASTDSSLDLSRALTDSEIDYGMFRRMRDRSLSDPWAELKARLEAFPPEYLASMESFIPKRSFSPPPRPPSPLRNEELRLRFERFFDEITVFTPDDPGLGELEEAVRSVDLKSLESDLESNLH